MILGAMTRKLRERADSASYSLWKKLHAMRSDRTLVLPAPVAILRTYRGHSSSNMPEDTAPEASKRSRSNLSLARRTSYNQISVSTASRWAK